MLYCEKDEHNYSEHLLLLLFTQEEYKAMSDVEKF